MRTRSGEVTRARVAAASGPTVGDCARHRKVCAVLAKHFELEVASVLAALIVESQHWSTARTLERAKAERARRLGARRQLGKYLRALPEGARPKVLRLAYASLERAAIAERMGLAMASHKSGNRDVVLALAEAVVGGESKAKLRDKLRRALRDVDEKWFCASTKAAAQAAGRGRRALEKRYRARQFGEAVARANVADLDVMDDHEESEVPSWEIELPRAEWEFGRLPAVRVAEHVERLAWVRGLLESGDAAGISPRSNDTSDGPRNGP